MVLFVLATRNSKPPVPSNHLALATHTPITLVEMARRQHLTLSLLLIVFLFLSISYFFTSAPAASLVGAAAPNKQQPAQASTDDQQQNLNHNDATQTVEAAAPSATAGFSIDLDSLPSLKGDSIAPKLENATLKAELGRATWRFLHTTAARLPDKPTKDERAIFETFMHLFALLYPCGDCARHFREILAKYPPQSGSRSAAAGWLCFAHNVVNERLEKPAFDCNTIGDFYDCGCADDDKKKKATAGDKKKEDKKE
ncbi:hypothetical protein LLEC1_04147 [Akanthomyces lecanii]|uniref:Sulfhydryl oxidase n=1 Tax=Cordyceps confragosa TaxID=2714763 RepID=A0A179I765_CORDF|nr:hypothetical protein LLEC1_04147 [Akanthomyces lecanii]